MLHQVFLDVEAMRETDEEDGSGWTYAIFYCPHRDDVDLDLDIDCIGGYGDPMELIYHMQVAHSPRDVDLDRGTSPDVDLDREPQWGFGEDWIF